MVCDICGKKGTRTRRVTRSYGSGESYLTAETLQEIERIKIHRRNLAVRRHVAVANFV